MISSRSKDHRQKIKGTLVLSVNHSRPQIGSIRIAAEMIKRGGLVAFPTETVYGLGADALNADAVRRIFKAKSRPADNPMIVHIARKRDVNQLVRTIPDRAEKLIDRYWPGPLTLIFQRSSLVPDITVAGLETIGIRMPSNKVALALIRESSKPIAAPSANRSGKPSPTTAQHVIDDLAGRIDIILDGGPTTVGVESTVIDMTTKVPQVLRPGGTPVEELKKVLGKVTLHPAVRAKGGFRLKARAPGMKHKHYAPDAEMIVVEGKADNVARRIKELIALSMADGKKVGVLATDETASHYDADVLRSMGSRNNVGAIAKNLFGFLREFDKEKVDVIIAEGIPPQGLGLAVMNRLRRAANFNVVRAG